MKKIFSMLLVGLLVLTGCATGGASKGIDMKEFAIIELTGKNGVATLEAKIDAEGITARLTELKIGEDKTAGIVGGLTLTTDLANGIMNGDVIEVTTEVSADAEALLKGAGVTFDNLTFEYEVKDLDGAVVITNVQLYKDVVVVEDGDKLTVKNNSTNKLLQTVEYKATKDGDDYTLEATLPEGVEVEGGVKPVAPKVEDKDGNTVKEPVVNEAEAKAKAFVDQLGVVDSPQFISINGGNKAEGRRGLKSAKYVDSEIITVNGEKFVGVLAELELESQTGVVPIAVDMETGLFRGVGLMGSSYDAIKVR